MERSEVDENSNINKAFLYISITFLSTCINALNGLSLQIDFIPWNGGCINFAALKSK